jgi:D-galactarolactone cycloisomerase
MSGHHCPSPPPLAEEASKRVAGGYRAVKLRLGDTLKRYIERTLALRSELGPDVALQADANCHYQGRSWRAAASLPRWRPHMT